MIMSLTNMTSTLFFEENRTPNLFVLFGFKSSSTKPKKRQNITFVDNF